MQGPSLPVHEPTQTSPQQHVVSVASGIGFAAPSATSEPWGQVGRTKALLSASLLSPCLPQPAQSLGQSFCLAFLRGFKWLCWNWRPDPHPHPQLISSYRGLSLCPVSPGGDLAPSLTDLLESLHSIHSASFPPASPSKAFGKEE